MSLNNQETQEQDELQPYSFKYTVYAASKEEAQELMSSFDVFRENMSNGEIIDLSYFVEENPEALPKIREMIINPPGWVKAAQRLVPKNWYKS